jgi:hypothetical protein
MVTEVCTETFKQLQHNTAKLQEPKLCINITDPDNIFVLVFFAKMMTAV